jgi:hypothetical protein
LGLKTVYYQVNDNEIYNKMLAAIAAKSQGLNDRCAVWAEDRGYTCKTTLNVAQVIHHGCLP